MRDPLIVLAILSSGACTSSRPSVAPRVVSAEPAQAPAYALRGLFIQPSGGTALIFCSSPGL